MFRILRSKYTNPARGILDFCKQSSVGPSHMANVHSILWSFECALYPVDNFGTVVGESPDRLLLSGTVVSGNCNCTVDGSLAPKEGNDWCIFVEWFLANNSKTSE